MFVTTSRVPQSTVEPSDRASLVRKCASRQLPRTTVTSVLFPLRCPIPSRLFVSRVSVSRPDVSSPYFSRSHVSPSLPLRSIPFLLSSFKGAQQTPRAHPRTPLPTNTSSACREPAKPQSHP